MISPFNFPKVLKRFEEKDRQKNLSFARSVLLQLRDAYGDCLNTGQNQITVVLGKSDYVRTLGLQTVMAHEVYKTITRQGITISFVYELRSQKIKGIVLEQQG